MIFLVIIMRRGFKIFLIILIFVYFGLYFSYRNGYYEIRNNEKKVLTEEMIKEYEEDLKNGVDVTNKEYTVIAKDYSNIYTKNILKVSKKVEKSLDRIIKYFFNKVGSTINE